MRVFGALLHVAAALFSASVAAHDTRPAYLGIEEIIAPLNAETRAAKAMNGITTYKVTWNIPLRASADPNFNPLFPARCQITNRLSPQNDGNIISNHFMLVCTDSVKLQGQLLSIVGLETQITDVLLRFDFLDGSTLSHALKPHAVGYNIPAIATKFSVVSTYFTMGAGHIGSGFDHLLFVLGLLLICKNWRHLFVLISSFTLAHSLTLSASILEIVPSPGQIVEVWIALSILLIALEILRAEKGESSLTIQMPGLVAFIFGLLHGFGFASGLKDVGLPTTEIPTALLVFNLGIEVGQLVFVAAVLLVWRLYNRFYQRPPPRRTIAYGIGCFAVYWVIGRIVAQL
ncbi:MAG: HupE/UreJ family protein [Kordiimonadaceae bacterium]|nr:HupE/UreJ family protein [Kordiimonadaceae bacterium]